MALIHYRGKLIPFEPCADCGRLFPKRKESQVRCYGCQYAAKIERGKAAYWRKKEEVKGCEHAD